MTPPASLHLSYRPDLEMLTARWLHDVTLPEFRAEYAAVLALAEAHGATRWLLDVRRRPVPPPGAAQWLEAEWLPPAARALAPARLRLAYLLSPQRLQVIETDAALRTAVGKMLAAQAPYDTAMFSSEGEAVAWLTGQPG